MTFKIVPLKNGGLLSAASKGTGGALTLYGGRKGIVSVSRIAEPHSAAQETAPEPLFYADEAQETPDGTLVLRTGDIIRTERL